MVYRERFVLPLLRLDPFLHGYAGRLCRKSLDNFQERSPPLQFRASEQQSHRSSIRERSNPKCVPK